MSGAVPLMCHPDATLPLEIFPRSSRSSCPVGKVMSSVCWLVLLLCECAMAMQPPRVIAALGQSKVVRIMFVNEELRSPS